MSPIAKAWAWIPDGVRACLAEIGNSHVAPNIAAAKLLGELLLVERAVGRSKYETLSGMKPELDALRRIATQHSIDNHDFVLWQIRWLLGSSEDPPLTSQAFAWEATYFLEASGAKPYSAAFWRQAAAQALQGALFDDGYLRIHIYNLTHAIFFGANFGIQRSFTLTKAVEACLPAISEMLENSREWDLYYEVQAARAMAGLLPNSWITDVEGMLLLPGQVQQGWFDSSAAEKVLLSNKGPFEAIYSTVHSTLAALLATGIANQKTRP